jgi:predicted MPP superfamily phosphohydrolase
MRRVSPFVIVGVVWLLLHAYVASTLFGSSPLGWAATLALGSASIAVMLAGRAPRMPFQAAMGWAGFTAMGLSSLLIVLTPAAQLLGAHPWADPTTVTASTLCIAIGLTAVGTLRARQPRVFRVDVPIQDLPAELERLRIVQLSDLHVGPTLKRGFVEGVVDTVNALAPDLLVLTGDVADGFPHALRHDVAPLGRLRPPLGKYFVTGNHEYYWDARGWVREVTALGFQVLLNRHVLIRKGAGRLLLAGVTDLRGDPFGAALGAPESDVRVLLAHQPKNAFAARAAGFDLQLSGHTHGGQYFPFNFLVRLFQPFVAGLHRLEEMWLYVSRGTGYWGPPLRLGAPAEITVLELVRA